MLHLWADSPILYDLPSNAALNVVENDAKDVLMSLTSSVDTFGFVTVTFKFILSYFFPFKASVIIFLLSSVSNFKPVDDGVIFIPLLTLTFALLESLLIFFAILLNNSSSFFSS